MPVLFQIIAMSINIVLFLLILNKARKSFKIIFFVYFIFIAIFVLPVILDWVFGVQDFSNKYTNFDKALNDDLTNILYSIFLIVTAFGLYFSGVISEKRKKIRSLDIRDSISNFKVNRHVYITCVLLMFLPVFLVFISPSPEKYLFNYAYFQKYADLASQSEVWYHRNVLRLGMFISLIAIMTTRLFSKNKMVNHFIIFSAALITGVLNGKRTLFAFIILGILIADIIKTPKGKLPIKRISIASGVIFSTFIIYAFAINKIPVNVTLVDTLRLYFFRDIDVKYSIYALLNSGEHRILEYWGQSYLFNILLFVPRLLWESKPYPYDIYITASVLNNPPGTVLSWSFQTSLFGEALSNLGWFGIPFSLILLHLFVRVSEWSKNPLIILLCIFIIVYAFMNHFGSFYIYFAVWLFLVAFTFIKQKIARQN